MIRHLILLVSLTAVLFSCTPSQVKNQLLDVESYIMERPDSALAVLESMDRSLLVTQADRAHHALLNAMALDKSFIDVSDDSLARVAVDYYSKRGDRKYYARALYYLGVAYYNQGEYNKAIVIYTKAEKMAEGVDSQYFALVKCALADTYAQYYNYIEELRYLRDANQIFEENSDLHYVYITKLELIHSLYNQSNNAEADVLLEELLLQEDAEDYIKTLARCTQAFIIVTNHNNPDFEKVSATYNDIFNSEYKDWMTVKDYWAWAYSLNAVGRKEEAKGLIDQLAQEESVTTSYWQYMIAKSDNDLESALSYLEEYFEYNNVEVSDALKQSLALSQRDYYESQAELSESEAERSKLWLSLVILSSAMVLLLVGIGVIWYVRKQKRTKEQYLLYISEIRHQLEEAKKDDYPALKRKYLALYKSRFETIGALCEQYAQSHDLVNAEKSIYRKVVSLVDEFTDDYTNREKFEAMLDEDLDNIMSDLRTEMPSLKDKDYMIFSLLLIGFDVTTISNLLNISANTVYIRKSRMKAQILEHNPLHKDQFIEAIG